MTVEELAAAVIDACDGERVDYMLTGAFAISFYGIPRSTKDIDVVLSLVTPDAMSRVIARLGATVLFDAQVQFDTLTWGRRRVGTYRANPPFKVELFELFDDPFVMEQFSRRLLLKSQQIARSCWLPSAEDLIVQKLRWARPKDLNDAKDVLAVQGTEMLDMDYIKRWCIVHDSIDLLNSTLAAIPPL